MSMPSVVLHPVRLQIVQALLGEELTTHQLHRRLPDVPIATLYRHVAQLVRHELIEVAGEQQVRGASEKTYRLAAGFANPTAEELAGSSSEELLTAFTVFTSGLIRDFGEYLGGDGRDLAADRVSFAQADFWATDEEVDELTGALMEALVAVRAHGPGEGRRRRKLTTILVPRPEPEAEGSA
ncbi:helix-turn-helix domain-containing protein [Aeromicrobium sp. YIM 150415]|uniref:helix-turn-helix domain-containing protein n=1 Tax=Aeromicrobium sp. YIM 150415 TaxID=2803912 RepID=UPI0019639EF7|nr:helix-turn-helix domain-containing protein [Aeromicrobium sp. YIM 150415]MBM9463796.1 helix-turn-helix domain-containing protein [Aeromicrobium sp. YIM 150415]